MRDVADQLREWSHSLAESIDPTDIERITSPGTASSGAFSNRRWLAVAASVIMVAGGGFAVATLGNNDSDRISPATNPPTPQTDDTEGTTATSQPSTSLTSDPGVAPAPQPTAPTATAVPTTSPTTTSPTTTRPETTTTTSPTTTAAPTITLEAAGLSGIDFGTDAETALAALIAVLGPPDDDSGWVDPVEIQLLGFCGPGDQRTASWADLSVGFVNSDVRGYSGLVAYSYSGYSWTGEQFEIVEPPLRPSVAINGGLTVFDSVEVAREIFGAAVGPISDLREDGLGRSVSLDLNGPWPIRLWLDLDGSDMITRIESSPCGE